LTRGWLSWTTSPSTTSIDMGKEKLDCSTRVPLTTTGLSITGAPPADSRGVGIACANEESAPDIRIEGAIAAVASIECNFFTDLASPRLVMSESQHRTGRLNRF
jgi:hypothetical protein